MIKDDLVWCNVSGCCGCFKKDDLLSQNNHIKNHLLKGQRPMDKQDIYYSNLEKKHYTEHEINKIVLKSDTLTSDNWEQEQQKIIDDLELDYLGFGRIKDYA